MGREGKVEEGGEEGNQNYKRAVVRVKAEVREWKEGRRGEEVRDRDDY